MIRAFIFDLDGVLTDTAEYHYRAWKRLADEEGLPFTREDNEPLRGGARREALMRLLKGRAGPDEVAKRTVAGLRDLVPPAIPGIVFLSGGQSPAEATEHLRVMNTLGPHPWRLSFSYGRALQEPALKAWAGKAANVAAAQQAFAAVAAANSAATAGKRVAEIHA